MVKEVNEAAAEYLQSNKHDCILNDEEASAIAPNNVIDSTFSLNLRQVMVFFVIFFLSFGISFLVCGWGLITRSGS